MSPGRVLPTATDTCRVWSVLLLPPQLELLWFSATFAALAVFGFFGTGGLVNRGWGRERAVGLKGP